MNTSKTFKILFRLIKARAKNGDAPIYVRITINGKRAEFSTDLVYSIDEWDSKTSKAIGRTSMARSLNDELDAILDRLVHSAHRINIKGESMRKKLKNKH